MKEELKEYLKEDKKGWKKIEDDLREIQLENIALSKKYVSSVEDNFSIVHIYFNNALQQVEYFII